MANVLVEETSLTGIADAIRAKLGVQDTYKPGEMAAAVESINTDQLPAVLNRTATEVDLTGVTTIPDSAFLGFTALESVIFDDNLTIIGGQAFWQCRNLSISELPVGLTSFSYNAFTYCDNVTIKEIPPNVTNISGGAFLQCPGITEITIPASTTHVQTKAFGTCVNLTKATFLRPSGMSIAADCFNACSALTDIYVSWSQGAIANAPWGATNATIHYDYTA